MKHSNFSRFLAPGTAVLVNDSQRLNAPGTIVEWSRLRHPIYGTPEAALVRMTRFGNIAVVSHHTIRESTQHAALSSLHPGAFLPDNHRQ